jgi:hypothetical protein
LLLLVILAACYLAADRAADRARVRLGAMFQPVMRLLLRIGLPRMLAALIIVLSLVSLS